MSIGRLEIALTLGLCLAPSTADALDVFASDCNFGFQDVYNAGDAVCVTGELDVVPPGGICAEAYVIVTPAGSANPFWDITGAENQPSANYVLGCAGAGAFFDEYVWLPPLVPGQYDLVIDQFPFFGPFGGEDLRVEDAFSVSNAPIVFSVDTAAIKAGAMDGLAAAQSLHDLVLALTIIDTLSTAADWAGAFGTGGALAAIGLGIVCYATGADCPTSYNSAVITIGNKIIGHMADALTLHYGGIIADPPDPMFEDVVALRLDDALAQGGPFTALADAPVPQGQVAIASLLATQAAAYQAMLPTLEKLQGAEIAGSHYGLLIQSEKLQQYAGLAIEAGDAMLVELDALEAALADAGTLEVEHDLAAMAQVFADGPTDEERDVIRSFGFADADIDAGIAAVAMLPDPGPASWQAVIEQARASYEAMRPTLVQAIDEAEAVRAENVGLTLRVAPVADITAPATGTVGESIGLQGSSSHLDPDAVVVYAWDLDADGEFDDGDGATIDFVPVAPGLVPVAVEASDGMRRDIALTTIAVSSDNAPPEFTELLPVDYAPFAAPGDIVELSVTATDADADPITYAWSVDGAPAGSGSSLAFEMPDQEAHAVRVVASDDDAYSPDAAFTFWVRASIWQGGGADTGDDTDGSGGGADDTAGSADDTAGGDTGGDASGTDGATGGEGDAGAAGEDGGGCGCVHDRATPPAGLGVLGITVLALGRRRARRRGLRGAVGRS